MHTSRPAELIAHQADRIEFQKKIILHQAWTCCLNCAFWEPEVCTLAKARPPAEVVVTGCTSWLGDVPF